MSDNDVETDTTENKKSTMVNKMWTKFKSTRRNRKNALLVVLVLVLVLVVVGISVAYSKEGYIGAFSLWGTPDWAIRNKGHMHQERSDSHVSKPKPSDEKWSMSEFKQSVKELNQKANMDN